MRILILVLFLALFSPVPAEVTVYSLEEVLERVHSSNRQLLNAADRVTLSQMGVDTADGFFDFKSKPYVRGGLTGGGSSGTNPALSLGYEFGKHFSHGTHIKVEPSLMIMKGLYQNPESKRHYVANVNTVITQPLLRGISKEYNLASVYSAEAHLRSSRRQEFMNEQQITVATVQAVYRVLRSNLSLEYKRRSYESLKLASQSARLKEKIGIADAMDVYRAELEFAQAEENMALALEGQQEALDRVKELMDLPLDTEIQVTASMELPTVEITEDDALEHALKERMEIDQAEDTLEDQLLNRRVAEHKLLPELNWVFNYSAYGQDQYFKRACTSLSTNKWGIGFAASGNYDRTSLKRGVKSANLSVDQADRFLLDVRQHIAMDVKDAYRALARARKRMEVQEDKTKKAEGKFKLAELKFERGLANNFDLIQSDKERLTAQESLTGARIDYIVGTYRLRHAIGTLMEKPNVY